MSFKHLTQSSRCIAGVGEEDAAEHAALNGSMHPPDESDDDDDDENEEDEEDSDEDEHGDTQMAGDASVAPKAATLEQHLGEGVGWMEEDDLQAAPAPAEGTLTTTLRLTAP